VQVLSDLHSPTCLFTEDVLHDVVAVLVLDEGLQDDEDLGQDGRPLVRPRLLQQSLDHAATVRITAQLGDLHRENKAYFHWSASILRRLLIGQEKAE
jgi:hypothetical protein